MTTGEIERIAREEAEKQDMAPQTLHVVDEPHQWLVVMIWLRGQEKYGVEHSISKLLVKLAVVGEERCVRRILAEVVSKAAKAIFEVQQ